MRYFACLVGLLFAAAPAAADTSEPIANSIGMQLVLIPAGEFQMGSKNELGRNADEEQRPVKITRAFYMGVYEVTQGEYQAVMGTNPSYFSAGGEGAPAVEGMDTSRFPVENVTWDEAVEFCRRLSELPAEKEAGRVYRLPTEAEWEYACRAGTTTPFNVGESLASTQANFDGNYPYLKQEDVYKGVDPATLKGPFLRRTTTVGSYSPNAFGLYDMHGNVWEWCADWYSPVYYKSSPVEDPPGPESGTHRIVRGGSWYWFAAGCRSAARKERNPAERRNTDGFRVVFTAP